MFPAALASVLAAGEEAAAEYGERSDVSERPARSGRFSKGARREEAPAWGTVPSSARQSAVSGADPRLAALATCSYGIGEDCFQGHHANILRNHPLIVCVIIVLLPSVH